MLSPPAVPEVRPSARVYRVYTGTALPWQPRHELQLERLPAGMTWRHTVYGGIFPTQRIRELAPGPGQEPSSPIGEDGDPEGMEARAAGDSAMFAITLTDGGRPLLG